MKFARKYIQPLDLAAAGVFLLGVFFLSGCDRSHSQEPAAPPPPEVAIYTVEPRAVELSTELPGRTSAHRVSEVRPQVNGIILERLFTEGSHVEAGELLYRIDPAPFRAALNSAEASLDKAKTHLPSVRLRAERYRDLLADNAVSRQDYDDAAAALDQARAEIKFWEAEVEKARISLGYTRVVAPISGRIGRSNVTSGALVTAYQATPLAKIQQLDPIYVDVVQSSTELLKLRRNLESGRIRNDDEEGKRVSIIMEDGMPYRLEGTLKFRDVTVDSTTGSYTLRILMPNPDDFLLPGMFVRAVVREGVAPDAVVVPQQGVSRSFKGEPIAMVVDGDGTVQQRKISLDRALGNKWLVNSGLSAGDRVIVEGIQKIRPGASVRTVAWEEEITESQQS